MTRLKIAYAFDNLVPSPQADTEQLVSTVAALSRRNVEISLLLPGLTPRASGKELARYYGVEGDFPVSYYPAPSRPRFAQKLWASYRLGLGRPVDPDEVLYTRNLPVAMGAVARGHRVVLDTYRPWPAQIPALRPGIRWLMSSPSFLGGILHSDLARKAYLELGIPEDRLVVAHNGYQPARMEPVLNRSEAREALGIQGQGPIVMYTGRIGGDKGLEVVLEMAKRCPAARFLLVGAREESPFHMVARSVPNVELVPWKSYDELSTWLYAADVLLVPPSEDPLKRKGHTVLPMKLFIYLASGRAILAGATPDVIELLADGENAALVPPGDPKAAAAALRRLLDDQGLRRRLGEGARRTAAGLTWDARAERIHRFILERISGQESRPKPSESDGSTE